MIENVLTVANAGDSRAVLCRKGGVTETLSIDHKPTQVNDLFDFFTISSKLMFSPTILFFKCYFSKER